MILVYNLYSFDIIIKQEILNNEKKRKHYIIDKWAKQSDLDALIVY